MGMDLRARLVRAGVELVAAEGPGGVSLREIARRAGVSHGAPRRYFPTHVELLSAVARQGFADLAAALEAAAPDLRSRAHAYARFARDNRGMYELMFRHDLLRSGRLGLRDASLPLFGALAAELGPVAAGALWANVHGIVQLWLWGSLPLATGETAPAALLDAALDAHLGRAS
ncbi:TetR/AcrR family transcriptional regulator [Dactylosporangium matsuzakiense]|uniref:TetR family transcriptional regulator n=2 Tax=Dactylosporangium matsuzakiense TaxID=53360 RepID=A0A9W6KG35_9ACTN|nr:TetR family transcriptional regulator [Dactylosporangium matsuzakiense]